MLMLMLDLIPQAETPGVTHFGAYHRPPDGHFFLRPLCSANLGDGLCVFLPLLHISSLAAFLIRPVKQAELIGEGG